MSEPARQRLLDIESELAANLASPRPDTLTFLNDAMARAKGGSLLKLSPLAASNAFSALLNSFITKVKASLVGLSPRL